MLLLLSPSAIAFWCCEPSLNASSRGSSRVRGSGHCTNIAGKAQHFLKRGSSGHHCLYYYSRASCRHSIALAKATWLWLVALYLLWSDRFVMWAPYGTVSPLRMAPSARIKLIKRRWKLRLEWFGKKHYMIERASEDVKDMAIPNNFLSSS